MRHDYEPGSTPLDGVLLALAFGVVVWLTVLLIVLS